jgi:hypothetical protein
MPQRRDLGWIQEVFLKPETAQQPSIVLVLWTWFALVFIATLAFFVQLALVPLTWWWDRNRTITGRTYRLAAVLIAR